MAGALYSVLYQALCSVLYQCVQRNAASPHPLSNSQSPSNLHFRQDGELMVGVLRGILYQCAQRTAASPHTPIHPAPTFPTDLVQTGRRAHGRCIA